MKVGMCLDMQHDIEIPGRAAVSAGLAFASETDPHAIVDALWDIDLKRAYLLNALGAMAYAAGGCDDLTASATSWARGDVDKRAKDGLLRSSDLPRAVAVRAADG